MNWINGFELLAVRVTGIYHYSTDFYISIGTEPYQFPFSGGLMWGGLTVCALRLAKRLNFGKIITAIVLPGYSQIVARIPIFATDL